MPPQFLGLLSTIKPRRKRVLPNMHYMRKTKSPERFVNYVLRKTLFTQTEMISSRNLLSSTNTFLHSQYTSVNCSVMCCDVT